MTTLETLLKQVEELDAEWNQSPPSTNYERMATVEDKLATAAPILVEVIRELVGQRDYEHNCLVTVGECEEMDAYNRQLDAIVAKRLKGEE